MKKFLIILLSLSFFSCNSQNIKNDELYPIRIKNKGFGYINAKGETIIEPQFELAEMFSENLACVRIKHKYGFINRNGEIVIEPKYRSAKAFKNGFAIVETTTNHIREYKYIKKNGEVLNFNFDKYYDFKEDMGLIYNQETGFGFINSMGEIAINPKYKEAGHFSNGLASVKIGNNYGYINKLGEIVVKPKYYLVTNFKNGLAAVRDKEYQNTKYIDTLGQIVLSINSDYIAHNFNDGLAMFKQGKGYGFVNKKGEVIINPDNSFEIVDDFNEGFARFFTKTETGFINKKGEIVFKVKKNVFLGDISEGMIPFYVKDEESYLNPKYGYLDTNGKTVIKPQFKKAAKFINGIAEVLLKNSLSEVYINTKGEFIYNEKGKD